MNSDSQQSEDKDRWRRERRVFFISPTPKTFCQSSGADFTWEFGSAATLLIRLLCQVLLHLSQADCSTGTKWGEGCRVGIIKHSTLTSCTFSFNDGQPNEKEFNTADMQKTLALIEQETICCPHKDGEKSVTPNSTEEQSCKQLWRITKEVCKFIPRQNFLRFRNRTVQGWVCASAYGSFFYFQLFQAEMIWNIILFS